MKKAKPERDTEKVTVLLPRETLATLARERARQIEAGVRLSEVSMTALIIRAIAEAYGRGR